MSCVTPGRQLLVARSPNRIRRANRISRPHVVRL